REPVTLAPKKQPENRAKALQFVSPPLDTVSCCEVNLPKGRSRVCLGRFTTPLGFSPGAGAAPLAGLPLGRPVCESAYQLYPQQSGSAPRRARRYRQAQRVG